jgi:hypothetical protein
MKRVLLLGACLGIAFLIGCSDGASTSGLNLEKSTVEEPGVTSQIEEVRPDIHSLASAETIVELPIPKLPAAARGPVQDGFWILPVSPQRGDSWDTGKFYSIRWQASDYIGNVHVWLYEDYGARPYRLLGTTINNGNVGWRVPGDIYPGNYKIAIQSATLPDVYGWSSVFEIKEPFSIKVTTPNGGQKWKTGKSYTLKWTHKVSHYDRVKIQLLKSGKHYKWISTSASKFGHRWKIPSTVATGNDYKIKITSTSDTTVTDTSNKNFTIINSDNSKLTVTAPNGGQKWKAGKSYTLKWTHKKAGAKVKIQLLKSGKQYKWISKSTKNDGKHVWKIPSAVATGSVYTIKITSTSKKTVTDTSNSKFTITKSAGGGTSLKISTPNGGQKYKTGQKITIRWVKGNGGTHVKIVLLKGGKAHKTIANKTKNDGQHTYTIPATIKTAKTYKIKVSSTKNAKISDTSNKNFTITKRASIDDDDDDDGGGDDDDGDDGR